MSLSARIGLGALVGLVVLTFVGYAALLRLNVLPRLAFAPGWALVDSHGARLTSEDLRGKITLYTFDHSANEDPGRQTHEVMRAVHQRLAEEDLGGVSVRLVTMTVNPDVDRPQILLDMSRSLGADSKRWSFVTGDSTSVRTAVNYGFGVYYEERPDGQIAFDPVFVLVDGLGIVRARYRFGMPDPDGVIADLMSVVREAHAETGSARLAYQAAHLFSCYAPPSQ